jgi:hypothetical protein
MSKLTRINGPSTDRTLLVRMSKDANPPNQPKTVMRTSLEEFQEDEQRLTSESKKGITSSTIELLVSCMVRSILVELVLVSQCSRFPSLRILFPPCEVLRLSHALQNLDTGPEASLSCRRSTRVSQKGVRCRFAGTFIS